MQVFFSLFRISERFDQEVGRRRRGSATRTCGPRCLGPMPTGRLSSRRRQKPGQITAAESTQNKLAEGGGIIPGAKHQRNTVEDDRSAHHPTRIHPGEKHRGQGREAASLSDFFLAHGNKQDVMSFASAFETRGANSGCICFKVLGRRFWFCRLLLKLAARGSRASGKKKVAVPSGK